MILGLRTDKPEAELYLLETNGQEKAKHIWTAHRELSATLLKQIDELITGQRKQLSDLTGVIIFKGPGSFTGLRIGATVANALADGTQISIVGSQGGDWLRTGVENLQSGQNDKIVLPEYGIEPNVTKPKK